MSMSDPFLPVHRDGTEGDPREIDLDHDVDVFFDNGAEGETLPASTATPPFRTPVPGDAVDEEQLDEDLGVTPPTHE